MPITRVLGKVATENKVMTQSNEPLVKKIAQIERKKRTINLEIVSAKMNLMSI
jgi:hypothetical protein